MEDKTMTIEIERQVRGESFTQGVMSIDGVYQCHTIEPRWRNLDVEPKVMGKTAIPAGTYRMVWSPSARWKRLMPFLVAVPQFEGVMIHPGNTARDSAGCILVGRPRVIGGQPLRGTVGDSSITFEALARKLREQQPLTITIKEPAAWKK